MQAKYQGVMTTLIQKDYKKEMSQQHRAFTRSSVVLSADEWKFSCVSLNQDVNDSRFI
jgi:hypothetical protein